MSLKCSMLSIMSMSAVRKEKKNKKKERKKEEKKREGERMKNSGKKCSPSMYPRARLGHAVEHADAHVQALS